MSNYRSKPDIQLDLSKEEFNSLIAILDEEIDKNNELLSAWARELKGKMIAHSFVKDDKADVRYFSKEASRLIYILFAREDKKESKNDYFEIMKEDFNDRQAEYKAKHSKNEE